MHGGHSDSVHCFALFWLESSRQLLTSRFCLPLSHDELNVIVCCVDTVLSDVFSHVVLILIDSCVHLMVNAKPFIHSFIPTGQSSIICTSSVSNASFYHQCCFYSTTVDSLVHTSIRHSFALLFFIESHINSLDLRAFTTEFVLLFFIIHCSLHSSVG